MQLCTLQLQGQTPSPSGAERIFPPGRALLVEADKDINAKKAKIGDRVRFTLASDGYRLVEYNRSDATIIPRGAVLLAEITEANPRTKAEPVSRLAFVFKSIEWPGNKARLNGILTQVEPPLQRFVDPVRMPGPTGRPGAKLPNGMSDTWMSEQLGYALRSDGHNVGTLYSDRRTVYVKAGARFWLTTKRVDDN